MSRDHWHAPGGHDSCEERPDLETEERCECGWHEPPVVWVDRVTDEPSHVVCPGCGGLWFLDD